MLALLQDLAGTITLARKNAEEISEKNPSPKIPDAEIVGGEGVQPLKKDLPAGANGAAQRTNGAEAPNAPATPPIKAPQSNDKNGANSGSENSAETAPFVK
jgi:hypothetical protein